MAEYNSTHQSLVCWLKRSVHIIKITTRLSLAILVPNTIKIDRMIILINQELSYYL